MFGSPDKRNFLLFPLCRQPGIDPLMVQLISNRVTDALATQLGQPRSAAPSVKTPQSAGLSRILESLLRR